MLVKRVWGSWCSLCCPLLSGLRYKQVLFYDMFPPWRATLLAGTNQWNQLIMDQHLPRLWARINHFALKFLVTLKACLTKQLKGERIYLGTPLQRFFVHTHGPPLCLSLWQGGITGERHSGGRGKRLT